ncbi:MAG: hypothetical protein KA792_10840, partial [Bacteroidales bacterium]|nr:hypothetical protein [Bacteroidales bacterium]
NSVTEGGFFLVNEGESWEKKIFPFHDLYLTDSYFVNKDTGFATCCNSKNSIIKTTDGGLNWTTIYSETYQCFYEILFVNENTGYVIGGKTILKTIDGGATWLDKSPGLNCKLYSGSFINADTGYVSGEGSVLKTIDGGDSWIALMHRDESPYHLNSLYFTDANTGYVVGYVSKSQWESPDIITKTTDGGISWEWQTPTTNKTRLKDVFFTSANTGYIISIGGIMQKTTNGGAKWVKQTTGVSFDLNSIYFPDSLTGYIVGNNGEIILKTINAGVGIDEKMKESINPCVFYNSQTGLLEIHNSENLKSVELITLTGTILKEWTNLDSNTNPLLNNIKHGIYIARCILANGDVINKKIAVF